MSREIASKGAVNLTTEEQELLSKKADGKLIFSSIQGHPCAYLIKQSKLDAITFPELTSKRIGAIYIARVKDVVPQINACFVEIAPGEICFLPLKEMDAAYFCNKKKDRTLHVNDEIIVQLVKEAQKGKQASVSTKITLSNNYFVMELGAEKFNFSSKMDAETKKQIKSNLIEKNLLKGDGKIAAEIWKEEIGNEVISLGGIIRTEAAECNYQENEGNEDFYNAFTDLVTELKDLLHVSQHRPSFSVLKKAPSGLESILQSFVSTSEFDEIVTDDEAIFKEISLYTKEHLPKKNVRFYEDTSFPINSIYSLETKFKKALDQKVWLKSGGFLVIQQTEAMVVIDVNSGKNESGKSGEEAAYKNNLEAAEEIAIQIRLRNLSGIIIIDFINMKDLSHQKELMNQLKKYVKKDRQKTNVIDMTQLGLVEMTRKKGNKPLSEQVRELKLKL